MNSEGKVNAVPRDAKRRGLLPRMRVIMVIKKYENYALELSKAKLPGAKVALW